VAPAAANPPPPPPPRKNQSNLTCTRRQWRMPRWCPRTGPAVRRLRKDSNPPSTPHLSLRRGCFLCFNGGCTAIFPHDYTADEADAQIGAGGSTNASSGLQAAPTLTLALARLDLPAASAGGGLGGGITPAQWPGWRQRTCAAGRGARWPVYQAPSASAGPGQEVAMACDGMQLMAPPVPGHLPLMVSLSGRAQRHLLLMLPQKLETSSLVVCGTLICGRQAGSAGPSWAGAPGGSVGLACV
jgi:hypothetical protein